MMTEAVSDAPAGKPTKISRKDHILQCLARMLETAPGERITTAALAKEVGVSEAALYRHFPSKARMFEGLIKFIEDTLFLRINKILQEESSAEVRCQKILTLLLTFAARNPGMTRLLTGDVLAGETERLRTRIAQFFNRLEAQLKQILREAQIRESMKPTASPAALANLLLACCEGRLVQFVRSEFKASPLEHWDIQWGFLARELLVPFDANAAPGDADQSLS
jgi:TetR/AcrR family transcriptional regulator